MSYSEPPFMDYSKEKAVCFTGHRHIDPEQLPKIRNRLEKEVEEAYAKGYRFFFCGGAIGFDTIAAQTVLKLRTEHPDMRLLMIIPCRSQCEGWSSGQQLIYRMIISAADWVSILSEEYYTGCMQVRNCYMVDHAAYCIAWMKKMHRSGTLATVHYAFKQSIPVKNIAMEV